jgi:two-component system sensor histidine kinase YesM
MQINRIAYKIFLGFLALITMILVIMTILVKTSYAGSLRRNEINFHIQTANKTKEQFDFIMGIIDDVARTIGSRPELITVLSSPVAPPAEWGDFFMTVYLQQLKDIQPFLGNISVVGAEGQFCSSSLAMGYAGFKEIYQRYAVFFNSGMYKDYFVDAHNFYSSPSYAPGDILTGVWPIYDIQKEKLLGQIYLGLNYSIFQDMFILSPTINNEKILIIDKTGRIVYNYPAFLSFDSLLTDYPELVTEDETTIEGNIFGDESFIVSGVCSRLAL